MLKDLVWSYEKAKAKFPDITFDSHKPKEGLYIRLRLDLSWAEQAEDFQHNHMLIRPKESNDPSQQELFDWFSIRDYYSSLVTMNKPVDGKKQIHSNNPFALFAKREVFLGEKDTSPIQEHAMRFLQHTQPHELKKKWEEFLKPVRTVSSPAKPSAPETFFEGTPYADALHYLSSDYREERLAQITAWYSNHLTSMTEHIRQISFQNYIKLFFTTQHPTSLELPSCEQVYTYEYYLYTIPKIFNSNDYNQVIDSEMIGLPGFNMNMNPKKPFLEHKSMRVSAPVRVPLAEAMNMKQAGEWLLSQPKYAMNKFTYESDFTMEKSTQPEGAYHIYVDGKDNEIISYENVPFPTEVAVNIRLHNVLHTTYDDVPKDYGTVTSAEALQQIISRHFFRGRMNGQFLYDESKPKPKNEDFTADMSILFMQSRQAFHDWIYKGTEVTIRPIFSRITLRLIEEQMMHVERTEQKNTTLDVRWLADAFNMRLSLAAYLEREGSNRTMGDRITEVMGLLKERLEENSLMSVVRNDEEFYFLVGQIAFYLKSQSEKQEHTGELFRPFLTAKSSEQLRQKLLEAYSLHQHKISIYFQKFSLAFSSVYAYQPEGKLTGANQEMLIAGLFSKNWFYEKKNKDADHTKGAETND